jgi:hypothetical protein
MPVPGDDRFSKLGTRKNLERAVRLRRRTRGAFYGKWRSPWLPSTI